jgi:dihydrofolate reductase
MISISIIVAHASNYVIGKDGKLPWHIPADLKYFKELTYGSPIIMGRKTFESIGRPLPGRHNIIITRNSEYHNDDCAVVFDFQAALQEAGDFAEQSGKSDIFIIGGAEVYRQAIDFADKAYITEVHADFDGDAIFDISDLSNWKEISRDYHANETTDLPYSFVVLTRIS